MLILKHFKLTCSSEFLMLTRTMSLSGVLFSLSVSNSRVVSKYLIFSYCNFLWINSRVLIKTEWGKAFPLMYKLLAELLWDPTLATEKLSLWGWCKLSKLQVPAATIASSLLMGRQGRFSLCTHFSLLSSAEAQFRRDLATNPAMTFSLCVHEDVTSFLFLSEGCAYLAFAQVGDLAVTPIELCLRCTQLLINSPPGRGSL